MVNEVVNGLTICPSRVVVVNCPPFRGALTACHPPHRAFAPYADAMTNKPSRTARCRYDRYSRVVPRVAISDTGMVSGSIVRRLPIPPFHFH
jgi:hypothetical protein